MAEESQGIRHTSGQRYAFNKLDKKLDMTLFETIPAYEFREHAQDIVDISWNGSREDSK